MRSGGAVAQRNTEFRCKTCRHPERAQIDAAIAAGETFVSIGQRFGLTHDSVRRHRPHLAAAVLQRLDGRPEAGARSALDRLEELYERVSRVLDRAESEGKAGITLAAARELRGLVEILARITGELDERPQVVVNLVESREWAHLQDVIIAALAAFPEARQAVASALVDADVVVAGEIEP